MCGLFWMGGGVAPLEMQLSFKIVFIPSRRNDSKDPNGGGGDIDTTTPSAFWSCKLVCIKFMNTDCVTEMDVCLA